MINFKNSNYRPLPYGLTLKPSKKHGLGLFATTDTLEAGKRLGITHVLYNAIYDHVHITWIRTPLGGFINHSENPNCVILNTLNDERELFTIRPIMDGEELTVYYTLEEYYDE